MFPGPRRWWLEFLGAALLTAICAIAQQASDGVVAAVPPAILTAKKVFISNAGADSGLFPHPFSGSTDRGYSQFYSAMQGWGRFEVVGDPGDAELVLELQLISPNGPKDADKQKGNSDPLPMFRLSIFDRKTHYALWTLTESIAAANLQKTHDRNFDDAVAALLADLKNLTNKSVNEVPLPNSVAAD
jgi:hypothetical protein